MPLSEGAFAAKLDWEGLDYLWEEDYYKQPEVAELLGKELVGYCENIGDLVRALKSDLKERGLLYD